MAQSVVVEGSARMYVYTRPNFPHLLYAYTAFRLSKLTPFSTGTMQRLLHRARDLLLDPRQPQTGHRHLRRRRRLSAPLHPRLLSPSLLSPVEIEEKAAADAPADDEYGLAAAAAEQGLGGHGCLWQWGLGRESVHTPAAAAAWAAEAVEPA